MRSAPARRMGTSMGIKTSVAALLVRAREKGARFDSTATVGRQSLTVPVADLANMAKRRGITEPDWHSFAADGYCEDFLRSYLGAQAVTSFDASPYQNASVVHDFNQPVPAAYLAAFDAVIDGGTMEHIFDVRQVLANYMGMVKEGGSLFIITPANNLCGHGFYQFSPELFYRVFSDDNGFRVESLCLIETASHFVERSRRQAVFQTVDPATLRRRISIVGDKPVSLYVHARRIAVKPLFATPPQQSDYKASWQEAESGEELSRGRDTRKPFAYFSPWEAFRRRLRQRRKNSLKNRKWFEPLVP